MKTNLLPGVQVVSSGSHIEKAQFLQEHFQFFSPKIFLPFAICEQNVKTKTQYSVFAVLVHIVVVEYEFIKLLCQFFFGQIQLLTPSVSPKPGFCVLSSVFFRAGAQVFIL